MRRSAGIADWTFLRVKFSEDQLSDWFTIFENLRKANSDSVCFAFSKCYTTFATRRQISALQLELAENDMMSEVAVLERLKDRQEVLEPYIFFDGVDS